MAASAPSPLDPAVAAARDVAAVAGDLGRTELVDRLRIAASRVGRPDVVICVVGEFKQGKSSLVNAVVSRAVCPVDDDLATSVVTVLRNGEAVSVTGHRAPGTEPETIDPARLADVVTERGNPANQLGYGRVELTFPNPFLSQGVVMVDTPGMGGLAAGHAAAVLGFLPFADALLFVSDLSAELSKPELGLLERAARLCPSVIVCLTKLDLYAHAGRIIDIDRGHLDATGLGQLRVLTVSSHLRAEALRRRDEELAKESGFDELFAALAGDVLGDASRRAAARLAAEVLEIVDALLSGLEPERAALDDQPGAAAAAAELDSARARLDHLRGPAARWSQMLTDGTSDLTNRVTHEFRAALRGLQRSADEAIESAASADAWTAAVGEVQDSVAAAVADAFVTVAAGVALLADGVRELVAEEGVAFDIGATVGPGGDIRELWSERKPTSAQDSGALKQGLGFVGGMQGGMVLVGTLGRLLPAAAASVLVANPVVIGAGLLMGGQKLLEGRKRAVAQRRQAARQALKQFVDDVQFEVGAQLADAVRTAQRQLRDQLQTQVAALTRSQAEAVERIQRDLQATEGQRRTRAAQLDGWIGAMQRARDTAARAR